MNGGSVRPRPRSRGTSNPRRRRRCRVRQRASCTERACAHPLAQIAVMILSIMERDRFLGVELRHLAALEAVSRTRSFGRAARDLGYTQSAVSQQIAQLERTVGQRLVDRPGGPRPVDVTDAGRLLLRHADAIVAQLDAAQADMAALAEGAAGPLRVGIFQRVGARILPGLIRRFKQDWPRVEVSVREETDAADLLRLLEHGELDLTFADLPLPEGPFES